MDMDPGKFRQKMKVNEDKRIAKQLETKLRAKRQLQYNLKAKLEQIFSTATSVPVYISSIYSECFEPNVYSHDIGFPGFDHMMYITMTFLKRLT